MNTMLMYLIPKEQDFPSQLLPNTAYYILGKEVRITDNLGQTAVFTLKKEEAANNSEIAGRLEKCEKKIDRITKYLSSFGGQDDEEQQ